MSSINLNIPESLASAAQTIANAGYICKPYRTETYTTGLSKKITQGLTVTVASNHPDFLWDVSTTHTVPYVAQVHDQKAMCTTPRGFQYFQANNEFHLSSELYSDEQIKEFVECFTAPFGLQGKIVGPLGIPTNKRKMRP